MASNFELFDKLPDQLKPDRVGQFDPGHVWTEHKAKLISRYLRYFVFITKHGAYIDGFAAPKQPDKSETWAAQLVLETEPKFLRQFFLCELKPNRAKYLCELKKSQPLLPKRHIEVIEGDFNLSIDQILSSGLIKDKTASFCLLDQFTCQCHWSTLKKLAEHKRQSERKIELFYFLGTGWLDRALPAFTRNDHIPAAWWGRPDWRSLVGLGPNKLVLKFIERFKSELGYQFVQPYPIYQRRGKNGRIMFYMIHASDHPQAPILMKRAYKSALEILETEDQLQLELKDFIAAESNQ